MELKHAVLFLVIYALSGCFASSSLRRMFLEAQLTHGGHVLEKNSSSESRKQAGLISRPNSVTDISEKVSSMKSKTTLAPTKGPLLSAKKKRKLKNERRQRKKLRELALKEKYQPFRRCKSVEDCGSSECCIRHGRRGFCKKRHQKRQRCKPKLKPGLEECPCQTGLTCAYFKTNRHGYRKYRCEVLTDDVDEREQA